MISYFLNLKSFFQAQAASCCIFPFFIFPVWDSNHQGYCIDGFFSRIILKDNPSKISVISNLF